MDLIRKIHTKKTIAVLLAVLMLLPIFQTIVTSAADSGMKYYENNFELPLYGATGCALKDVSGITAGSVFTILEEQDNNLKVKLSNGTEITIVKAFCMINLPDVVPSIKYDITNSYSSVFKVRGANIAGITGASLYQNGTSKKNNPRLGKDEFLVPVLYETAIKIAAAQKKALSEDYTLVMYEAYRPTFAQDKVYAAYSPLVTADIRGDYPVSWFIASGKSNHQEGYAVDLSLAKVTEVSFNELSNPAYKIANLTVTNCEMVTPIHDLTVDSAVYNYQSGMVIYDKTAWQSYTKTAAFAGNTDSQRLQKYCTDAGLTPFAAEWWHFNDVDARNNLGDLAGITGNWEMTINRSMIEAAAVSVMANGDAVTLFTMDSGLVFKMSYDGSRIGTTDAWYTGGDGVNYPAYCIEPSLPGVGEESGSYDVTLSDTGIDDPKIYGIILAGYPYKTFTELGLPNAWEAAFATKFALKIYLEDKARIRSVTGWSAHGSDNQYMYDAVMSIYNAGITNTVIPPVPSVIVTADGGNAMTEQDIDGEIYFVNEYTVTSNAAIKSYTVSITGSKPKDTIITEIDGTTEKTTFNAGEKFRVLVPKTSVTSSGSITLDVKGEVVNHTILYGTSSAANTQDYAVTGAPIAFKNASAYATFEAITTTAAETTQPTTTPDSPNGGTLVINKYKAGTLEGLPGAVFEIRNSSGTVVSVVSTDGSGRITLTLPSGVYSVTEITPPLGYALDENAHKDHIIISPDLTTTVDFSNEELTTLEVIKVDAETTQPLSGATIRLAKDGGTQSWDKVTNSLGIAVFDNIESGTYTITEIVAPSGYILDSTPHIIVIEAGKPATITLVNHGTPGLIIRKFDEHTGILLGNAEFSVRKMSGEIVYEGITPESGADLGTIRVENLEEGWYEVVELAAPFGYLKADESKNIFLSAGKTVEIKFDNRKRPSLSIIKVDADTNEPLAGAKFKVQKTESATVSEYITDENGEIFIQNLDEAVYSVWEFEAPFGYVPDSTPKNIQLEWGTNKSLVFTNKSKPKLEIVKIDEATSEPLSGAKFKVFATESKTVSEYVTDESGRILIENLNEEIYTIEEIVAPDGYLIETQHKDIALEAGTIKTVIFTNKACPKLEIKKIDSVTKQPLTGAKFKVTKTENLTVSEYVTDESGTILIENLDEAIYTVEEITSPDGYILEPQIKTIQLEWGKTKTLIYENTRKPALIINKVNGLNQKPIPNTMYRVQYEGANGGVITLGTYKTDSSGRIVIPKVNPGWYIITEILPAPGYSLAKNPVTRVYLNPGENAYLPDELTGVEQLEQFGESDGVTFEGESDGTEAEYSPLSDSVTVSDGSEFMTFADGEYITNFPLNSIVIKKTDAVTGELLAGAVFELRQVTGEISGTSGTIIGRYVTGNSGIIVVTGLEAGVGYIVEEVLPPTNYLLSDNSSQQARLKGDGTSVVELTFSNYPYGHLLVLKIDAVTKAPLAGARFKVTDGTGAVAGSSNGEFVTDVNGQFLASNLKPNSYVVTEIEAPSGYIIDSSTQTIHIGIDGKTYTLTFGNQPSSTIVLRKLDSVTREPLADAEFMVTASDGSVVGTSNGVFKTDATGTITIPHLPKGSYIVQEIKAPTDYILENQSQTIAVDYGKTYTLDFYNKHMSGLQIIKIDSVTKQPLKGAEFAVYKQNGELFGRYTTDADGVIIVDTLEPGWYKAVETKTLDGYLLDETPKDFEITANQFVKLVFENAPMSSLIIRKVDADTRQPLEGAEFTVKTMAGALIGNYVSDEDGLVTVPALMPGWYTVTETVAPVGYSLGDNVQNVEITNSKTVTVEFRNLPFGSLVIKKTDEFSGVPIAGAQFTVSHQNGAFVGEYVTGGDGTVAIPNVEPGWYVISETKAPSGYQFDNTARTVEVKPVVPTIVTFTNKPLTAIEIVKVDSITRLPLADATFKVERPNGEVIGTYKTEVSGKALVSDLTEGTYIVSEISAPSGYMLTETPKTVVVTSNKVTIAEFSNKPFSGIQILKTDANTNAPLQGAVFTIQRVNGERVGEKYTTDVSGKIIVHDLPEGIYIVSEVQAPAEYVLDALPQTVEVKSGKLTVAEFVNTPFPYLHIVKTNASTGELVSGAEFMVANSKGEIIANVVSQSTGAVSIKVAPGVYTVRETKAPDGFEPNDSVQTVEVRADGNIVFSGIGGAVPGNTANFANRPLNAVEIVKLDAITNNPLSHAVFEISKSNGDNIGSFRTDKSGSILVTGLTEGQYIIAEISAPDGFILDEIPQTVNLSGGKLVPVTFFNKPLSGIQILKLDSVTQQPLKDASFRVTRTNGEVIGTFRTEADGMAVVPNLDEGTYTVNEIAAPSGYQLDNTPKSVNVVSGKLAAIEFYNKPHSGIEIIKTDAVTQVPLENATFTVDRSNGERIGVYKTDSSGKILVSDLSEGTYIVSETASPNGYVLDQTPKTVTVVSGRVTAIEFTNEPYGSLIIRKTDEIDGRPLAGTVFTVKHQGGSDAGEFTTGNDGSIVVPNLKPGWYVVSEIKPPNGYHLDSTAKTIEVKSHVPTSVSFTNRPFSGLQITKLDAVTNIPLQGAKFTVTKSSGEHVGNYTTGADGSILISDLSEGVYVVGEIAAPNGYQLDSTPKNVTVVSGKLAAVEFVNQPYGSLIIKKTDEITARPLAGAHFTVKHQDGAAIGDFITDNDGSITILNLEPDWYVVSEIRSPNGYHLDSAAKTVEVKSHAPTQITFTNRPFSGIEILKTDANTNAPLQGAVFTIQRANGERVGDKYTTDVSGKIIVHDLPEGVYIISEVQAPAEYVLDAQPQTMEVKSGVLTFIEFVNTPFPYLHIIKTNAATGELLSGAEFIVTNSHGEIIANVTSQASGAVSLKVAPGVYTITETKAPDGFELNDPVQTVEVRANGTAVYYGTNTVYPNNTASFANRPLNAIEILKLDVITKNPLANAVFKVSKSNGDNIGTFRTDNSGTILLSGLTEGSYIIGETSAPYGFILDEIPQTINVSGGKLVPVTFLNIPLSVIQITKLDAVTQQPLGGASFSVTKANGEQIGTFRTEADRKVIIPDLDEGVYVIGEISAPNGYQLDNTPKNVTVASGRLATVEFYNKPFSGVQILKTDAVTGIPLANATFEVKRSNGESIGIYKTDTAGQIFVHNLAEGDYIVSETASPNGYVLDQTPKTVTVVSGRIAAVNFTNTPYGSLVIRKTNEIDGRPLAGAVFTVKHQGGSDVGEFITGNDGSIAVPNLKPGWYVVSETKAPTGYHFDSTAKMIEVKSYAPTQITFTNRPYSGIRITKLDAVTREPLQGAEFSVTKANGERIDTFRTEADGKIIIPDLTEGVYVVSEIAAPNGYQLDEAPKNITVTSGKLTTIEFTNKPLSGIQIIKTNAVTNAPLAGATFKVTKSNGEVIGTYKTDNAGHIIIPDLAEGTYVVAETIAPDGFMLDETPKNIIVTSGRMAVVEFTNKPHSGIEILKLDEITRRPLSGAAFTVERDNGEKIGTYRTDSAGKIIVSDLAEGTYIVSETFAPDGYQLDEAPKTVIVKSGKLTAVEFSNKALSGIEVIKIDAVTKAPLMGATFIIERPNGEKIGTFSTDVSGKIIVSDLTEGTYIVSEKLAPYGYQLDETPKTVVVTSGKMTSIEFTNKPFSGILITKLDALTKAPLTGATFVVERANGEKIGTFKSDSTGKIIVPDLSEGTYIVSESASPDGYILDETPKTIEVKSGKLTEVEFLNKPLAGLRIIKLDSVTRNPIEGVEFAVNKMNGERIENDFRSYNFKTDKTGQIYIPQLENGYYVVTETRTVEGYILDGEPKTVLVESGKITVLEVLNTPMSGLLVVKTDEVTGEPIAGVVFDIKRADGAFVTGSINDGNQPNTHANSPNKTTSPNGDITGSYTTDANGRILINGLDAGQYTVTERKAADGYQLDTNVYNVTVLPGKLATLQLTNKPLGGIRLTKIDSITKKPIFGVEFMLFDINGKVIGVYYTNNNGVIDFPRDIPAGRYTIRETRAANGYYIDEMPKTVEFTAGKVTEIVWENIPQLGQIQILKKSADENEINGLPAGTPLEGAVFEVYNHRTGALVDRFVSGKDGRAVSNPLPLGRYLVKEVQAPKYYILSDKILDIELEFATQIIKQEFLNYSANTGVSIRKIGNVEAMPGNEIRYDIKELRNTGTVPLTDFYWRDILPTNAVRLTKIVTGTFNQSLKYKITITTNKGDTRVIADNLSTTKNNVIDCSNAALGLKSDEFITSFSVIFGTVRAGFSLVETPQIFVKVLPNLQNGLEFANKVDVGGKHNGEFIVSNSTWKSTIFSPQSQKLPKTGW